MCRTVFPLPVAERFVYCRVNHALLLSRRRKIGICVFDAHLGHAFIGLEEISIQ